MLVTAHNPGLADLFYGVILALFAAAIAVLVRIVQDVVPYLDEQDRSALRWTNWFGSVRPGCAQSKALTKAWSQHVQLFPDSRKRVLFACCLLAASLSVMAYPLWFYFSWR
jgi:hypothetical protein